jgi:hypothetical protein
MVRPYIAMRVKQPHGTPRKWIPRREAPGFVAITRGTTQTEIIELGAPLGTAWNDMVYLKGNTYQLLGTQAIGTPALRGGHDRLTDRLRDTGHVSCFE